MPKSIVVYADKAGKEPITSWLGSLKDSRNRRRILTRLRRVEQGNYGDCKHIQNSVFELRLFFGPGYRIYFGEDDDTLVVLLCGGDKGSQDKDVQKQCVDTEHWTLSKRIISANIRARWMLT